MRIASTEKHSTVPRRAEAAILFDVGGYKFAISATDVDEIRHLDDVAQPGPEAFKMPVQKVRFTRSRDRSSYMIVDASLHFHLLPSKPSRVLILRTGTVALTADSIDRMVDISSMMPLPLAFQGEERKWFRGLALVGDSIVPVVNPDTVLSDAEAAQHARDALTSVAQQGARS